MFRNLGPRRFGEHKEHSKMAEVAETNLREGDILIAKEWSNTAADVAFVRTSQAVFSHMSGGSSQSEHVLLNCKDGGAYTVESLSQGINTGRHSPAGVCCDAAAEAGSSAALHQRRRSRRRSKGAGATTPASRGLA